MMFITKIFGCLLCFSLCTFSFCYGNVVEQQGANETKIVTDSGKSPVLISKNIVKSAEMDFQKLWAEVSKKFSTKPLPLLTIEGESLSKLFPVVTQFVDKVFPDYSSLISLAITGFAGGVACPGVDENAACYMVICLHEGRVEPVFVFKALTDCMLVKNLLGIKNSQNTLKTIPNVDLKKCSWHLYGEASLLNTLEKYLREIFPFIYTESNSTMNLKINLDFNLWSDIFEKIRIESKEWTLVKFLWDTFVIPEIKSVEVGFNILDKTFVEKICVHPQAYSPLSVLIRALESKNKEIRFLNWSSRETLQELTFQNYSGLKNYVESLESRVQYVQAITDFSALFKELWAIFYPQIKDVLMFFDENFTGNTQSYADLQCLNDFISSKGFGFLEGKRLAREEILRFVEDFAKKLKSSFLKLGKNENFGLEFFKNLSLEVQKSVDKYHNCDIDQVFWKSKGNNAYYPVWFAVCKNYLLYSDDIANLRRLIERMEETKVPAYLSQEENCFSKMKIDLGAIIRFLNIENSQVNSEVSMEITGRASAGNLETSVIITNFLDIFSAKTRLPLLNENAKKEEVDRSKELTTTSVQK